VEQAAMQARYQTLDVHCNFTPKSPQKRMIGIMVITNVQNF